MRHTWSYQQHYQHLRFHPKLDTRLLSQLTKEEKLPCMFACSLPSHSWNKYCKVNKKAVYHLALLFVRIWYGNPDSWCLNSWGEKLINSANSEEMWQYPWDFFQISKTTIDTKTSAKTSSMNYLISYLKFSTLPLLQTSELRWIFSPDVLQFMP